MNSVIVVTDRVMLDQQLQNTIYQFEHKQGVVQKIDEDPRSWRRPWPRACRSSLPPCRNFPLDEKIGDLPKRKMAVIVDEAHSSQSGETATELKGVLAPWCREEAAKYTRRGPARLRGGDPHDHREARQAAQHQLSSPSPPRPNSRRWRSSAGGEPTANLEPFHLYSMRQAIEEGFILDVLQNYTTYKTYYRLVKSIEDDPQV